MLIHYLRPFYEADKDSGAGESGETGDVKASDIVNRYGNTADSALRLAEKVADLENKLYRQREKNRAVTTERDELKAKLPADGAVVVAKDDVAELETYRALGKAAELKQALDAKQAAEHELTGLKRDATLRDVQEATGFDRDVLKDIGGAEWQYTIKTEQVDGKDERRVYVKDGDAETLIEDHPKVKRFLPALKPASEPRPSYDINAGARGSNQIGITEAERIAATRRYQSTF